MLICPTAGLVETSHSHYFTVSSLLPAFKMFCKTASNPSMLQLLVNVIQGEPTYLKWQNSQIIFTLVISVKSEICQIL